jgi:methylmalonyl-CoA/ethylmalonyl-CoA epimerase
MTTIKRIDHIAIAVSDMEAGTTFWHTVLGLPLGHLHRVEEEGVDVAFLPVGGSALELLQPFQDNGVMKYLQKRGPGIHHICFETDDIDGMLAQLEEAEIQLITPQPLTNAEGKRYAFVHPKSTGGVLVELYQLPETA